MPDEIIPAQISDGNKTENLVGQATPEPTQRESIPENQISETSSLPESPQVPTADTPISPTESAPTEMPPGTLETSPGPEGALPVKDDIPANEPLESSPAPNIPNEQNNPNVTIEKHGNDVTITEVMGPTAHLEPATAQMAGNEPIDLAEEQKTKRREENLKLANQTRQEKKRKKIDAILDLFAKQTNLTNDEVEKLLHVSDATATRYLETLEKEGKIKQVGKTGKGVMYEKI